jgi:16S rRNA (uracil1498-N3)-methyltransferase
MTAVCRLRPGARVYLFNGDGRQYPAELIATMPPRKGKASATLSIVGVEEPQRELGFRLRVAVPLPKGERAQFLVEKLTELGVTSLVPLETERSVVQPREARLERLQRQVIEASKQCGRNVLLQVEPLSSWANYCVRSDLPALRLLAHPGAAAPAAPISQDVALAVGPEGGFTEKESEVAERAGWCLVGLGPRILRVETAALALAAWVTMTK